MIRAAPGGVRRNFAGMFQGTFLQVLRKETPFFAELQAVILDVKLAVNGWRRIWLECDYNAVW